MQTYDPIVVQLSNHPDISAKRMCTVEIEFLTTEIRLSCIVHYEDSNGNKIQAIPPKHYTATTFNSWVSSKDGSPLNEGDTDAIPQADYLANLPNTITGSSTAWGNNVLICKGLLSSLDQRGFFNS